jgi:hypothetical protein
MSRYAPKRRQHGEVAQAHPHSPCVKEGFGGWRAGHSHDAEASGPDLRQSVNDLEIDKGGNEHEIRTVTQVGVAAIDRGRNAFFEGGANGNEKRVCSCIDDERNSASLRGAAGGFDPGRLIADGVERPPPSPVVAVFQVDANDAKIENGIHRLDDVSRCIAIAGLDVGADRHCDGVSNRFDSRIIMSRPIRSPSGAPRALAMPPLVVPIAGNPAASRMRALAPSQALGSSSG